MAWLCQEEKQWINVYKHWKHMCKMKSDTLNSYVFEQADKSALNSNCRHWVYKVRKYFADTGMGHVCICSNELNYNYVMSKL